MKRSRAQHLLSDLLTRVAAATAERPLSLVDEVHVFGSFARGAVEPHDVDVAVEFTLDREFAAQCAWDLSRGRDPFTWLRRALTGGSRSMQFQFQELKNLHRDGIATTLLWRRGEPLSIALERLDEIRPDPRAGRAERDHMLPAFEGIDRWVPLPVRHLLADWSDAAAVQVEQVLLPDQKVRDRHARQVIADRWIATSPLHRAGTNAVAYFEAPGHRSRAAPSTCTARTSPTATPHTSSASAGATSRACTAVSPTGAAPNGSRFPTRPHASR